MPPGHDWPVFWNDPYDATPYGYNVYLPQMRYSGWLNAVQQNPNLVFSPISMPSAGAFTAVNWNIAGGIAPVSNQYDLLPELRARDDDFDGDGVSNWEELASGLDPKVADRETTETDCHDGIDNDANKRTDLDDTLVCGDITLAEGETRNDFTLAPASVTEKRFFQFTVPPGSTSSSIRIEKPTGNVDLYIRYGDRPTTTIYDFESRNTGKTEESVTINSPAAGVWHIMVNGVQEAAYQIRVNTSCIVNPSVSSAVSVIACDMDNNRQDDIIFLTEGSGVRVYANAGSWLNLQTGQGDPTLIACGDFDGNGIKEIIGAFAASHSLKFFSRESWTWSDLAAVSEIPGSMVVKDIDSDGKAEIIGLFNGANAIKLRRGSTGKWETIPLGGYPLPDEILVAELAENPHREILGVWRGLNQIRFYNFFTASWNSVALPAGYGSVPDLVSAGDIDSDGISDIVVVWNGTPYSVQIRVGFNGDWKEIIAGSAPDSVPDVIDVADADADQKDDVFMVWNAWNQIWMYLQQWKGAKLIYKGPPPALVVSGNFDGDSAGRKDFAGIWQDGTFKIWMNNSKFLDMTKFSDVPLVHWAYPYIDNFADQGITSGCKQDDPLTQENETEFCPDGLVTRAQMAIFLTKALNEAAGVCKGTVFNDVNALTVGDGFCKYIEKFSTMGITAGCGNGNYCPNDLVSRAQMAVFLTNALGAAPAASCTGKSFNDINAGTVGDIFCRYIEKFATLGITSGCGNGNFCPDAYVTRAQMAVFLTKAFLQ
jgi:hypothetical protein